jgi:GNAT superfamily N-acetyltransferase
VNNGVSWPAGLRLESLIKAHPRKAFVSGQAEVDNWIRTQALQHQGKHLSATKALLDDAGAIAGYYTLATGQVDFGDLPVDLSSRLPKRQLPVAVLAWLGVAQSRQGQGLGKRLLAQALRDCFDAGKTFAFIAVILDCVNQSAKDFYQLYDFKELPGHPFRLYLSSDRLEAMMTA